MNPQASVATDLPRLSAQPAMPGQQRHRLLDVLLDALRQRLSGVSHKTPAPRPIPQSALFYMEPSALGAMADWWGLGSTDTIYDVWPTPEADAYALASDWYAIGADLRQAEAVFRAHMEDVNVM